MGLKCSIFGCDYGETEVEREREEDGNEVVVTIRETETCKRCGNVHLVSENKEVTTMETAADIVAEDLEEDDTADDTSPTGEPGGGPATAPDAGEPDAAVPEGDDQETVIPDAENERAVKMGDTGTESETTEMPPAEGEDDAVILDDDDEDESDDDEREPGEWPEEPEDDDEWEQPTDTGPSIEDDSPDITSTGSAITVPEGEFHCPECGYTTAVESSSLREGDYCPECHRGSLRHEPE